MVDPRDVRELQARVRELERELSETRAELAALRRQWANWLALISHDLRGPLTLVLGHAQNLLRRRPAASPPDERERRELEAIVGGARRVDKMIGQVVDAARLEAGLLTCERRDVDLPPLLREEARKATRLYPGRRFQVNVADALPPVYVDSRRASQVIGTLLSNAAQYSAADAAVEVRARSEADRVVVAVRDQGIGLTDWEKAHVFDRAFQSERAREARREGLGLSLTIARHLCQLLGGDLWAESDGPDRGSVFYASFPLLPADYVVE